MVVCAGVILMIMGVIGKFGAIFVTIPTPVIGGVFMVMFGECYTIAKIDFLYDKELPLSVFDFISLVMVYSVALVSSFASEHCYVKASKYYIILSSSSRRHRGCRYLEPSVC